MSFIKLNHYNICLIHIYYNDPEFKRGHLIFDIK